MTQEDEYKAKLAENRRLAREKAERESAEEQERAEERKYVMIDHFCRLQYVQGNSGYAKDTISQHIQLS